MATRKPRKALRREPMSRVDTAWLRMERPTNPMMITGVLMFTEPMSLQRLKRVLEKRFLAYTRFLLHPVVTAAGATWQADAHFGIDWHVHLAALPGQGDGQIGSAHVEIQSLMRRSCAVFCLNTHNTR